MISLRKLTAKASLVFLLITCHNSSAQTDINIQFNYSSFVPALQHYSPLLHQTESLHLNKDMIKYDHKTNISNQWHLSESTPKTIDKNFEIKHSHLINHIIGLGGYRNLITQISFENKNSSLSIGQGLTIQNTYNVSNSSSIHLTLSGRYEYSINKYISLYAYGQYLSNQLNQSQQFNPIIYMNPSFMQSNSEMGLKAKYKSFKLDIGTKTIFDTQFEKSKPLNIMNSRLNIAL